MSPKPRFFYGWLIVFVSVLAAAFSPATLVNMPFGLFIPQLEQEFGWTRTEITASLSIFLVVLVILLPFVGRLIDRIGIRRIAVPSILLYSTALASLSLLTESLLHLYVVYGLIAALGIGAQSVAFIKALCAWFDRRRGLVIGICMAGFGIGYVLVPLITHALIEQFGWRSAYLGLGLLAMLLPLPATALLLRDTPAELGLLADGEPVPEEEKPSAPPQTGQSLSDALRSREMWLLAASFALMSAALNGLQSQFVPLLTGRGFSAAAAATLLAGVGVGSFPGRILVGWLVDKFFAPHIAFVFYAVSAGGIFLIIQGGPFSVMFLCAVIIGLSLGAENDVLGYLTGRYFGLRCFGQIYATLLASYLIGAAAGPIAMAYGYDEYGTYQPVLYASIGVVFLSCICLLLLRRYPMPARAPRANSKRSRH